MERVVRPVKKKKMAQAPDFSLYVDLLHGYQRELSKWLVLFHRPEYRARLVCGLDVSYCDHTEEAWVSAVTMELPDLKVVEELGFQTTVRFPYISGLMCFREGPLLVEAVERLKKRPDTLLVDGHGIAHPRRFGLASYVGLFTGIPTVGCAKRLLKGQYIEGGKGSGENGYFEVKDHSGATLGASLRLSKGVKPIIASPGHLTDLRGAVETICMCSKGHRLPEPLRLAHLRSRRMRRRTVREHL